MVAVSGALPEGMAADQLVLDLDEGRLLARNATAAFGAGQWRMKRLQLEGQRLKVEGATVACGCEASEVRLHAARIEGQLDRGLWLHDVRLAVGGTPALWLPVYYQPVGPRRSGLLPPQLGLHPGRGPWGRLPIYLAPDSTWDLTLSPGWSAGRGPTLETRLRWATTASTSGEARLEGLLDWAARSDGGPLEVTWRPRARLEAHARSRVGSGTLFGELNWVSDATYLSTFGDFATRRAEWTRSQLTWTQSPGRDLRLGASVLVLQDVRRSTLAEPRQPSFRDSPSGVRQRWLEVRLDELPRFVFGGRWLMWSGDVRASLHAGARPEAQAFVRMQVRRRADLVFLDLPRWGLDGQLSVQGQLTGWGGDVTGLQASARADGVLRHRFVNAWSRGVIALRYALEPGVGQLGLEARPVLDEVESFGPLHQLRAEVAGELGGAGALPLVRGELRLGVDLDPMDGSRPGAGLSALDGRLRIGPRELHLWTRVVVDVERGDLEWLELRGRAQVGPWRLEARGWRSAAARPRWFTLTTEELVPGRVDAADEDGAQLTGVVASELRLPAGWRLGLELSLSDESPEDLRAAGAAWTHALRHVRAHVGLRPDQGCFELRVSGGTARDLGGAALGLQLGLTML